MDRIVEPELMEDEQQALAYASADFSESDAAFVDRFIELSGDTINGRVIDLGCGPGNISLLLVERMPAASVTGLDGSKAMLDIARERAAGLSGASGRPAFIQETVPYSGIGSFDYIVSNSLLHHLHDPMSLWKSLRRDASPGAVVFFNDLRRPSSEQEARQIVDTYAGDASKILQEDFFASLLAAFTPEEVEEQLSSAGLNDFQVRPVADRYLEISGTID